MIKRSAALGVLLGVLAACSSPSSPLPSPPEPDLFESYAWPDRSPFASGLAGSEASTLDALPGAPVYHADLALSDDALRVEGHEEIEYTNQESIPLAEICLRLYPELLGIPMTVSGVRLNGEEIAAEAEDGVLRLTLDPSLDPGSTASVGIDFALTVPTDDVQGYGLLRYSNEVLSLSHVLPMAAVFDEGGWSLEPPAPHGDLVFSDASFFLVRVSAPEALTLVTSGTEIDRRIDGGRQHVTFAAGPARDFFLAASRRFTQRTARRGDITLRSTTLSEYDETSDRALQITGDALGIFQTMLGDYPYDELDIVTTDLDALGMEYPGLFAIALPLFEPNSADYPPGYLEATLVHELAHQWFFNLVGNDPAEEPWLDEALAQFATQVYFEQEYAPAAPQGFLQSLRDRWQRVGREPIPIGLPAASYTSLEYGAIVYGRGPLFLIELRHALGEPVFDEFLHDYVQSNRWGIATTQEFQALAEEHCGCSLRQIFDDWVYPP
jgi:hypothetical protein